jgi:hypothetical protein
MVGLINAALFLCIALASNSKMKMVFYSKRRSLSIY